MLLKMLSEFLEKRVNQEMSFKMKLLYESNTLEYFKKRMEIEEHILTSTDWLLYFEEHIHEPELEDPSTLDDSDLLTIHKVFIEVLKKAIDSHQETEPTCTKVLTLYQKTKTELESRFADYPRGDSFTDYLEARTEREQRDNARISGSMCPNCGSRDITSYGDKWKCRTCRKLWRKR